MNPLVNYIMYTILLVEVSSICILFTRMCSLNAVTVSHQILDERKAPWRLRDCEIVRTEKPFHECDMFTFTSQVSNFPWIEIFTWSGCLENFSKFQTRVAISICFTIEQISANNTSILLWNNFLLKFKFIYSPFIKLIQIRLLLTVQLTLSRTRILSDSATNLSRIDTPHWHFHRRAQSHSPCSRLAWRRSSSYTASHRHQQVRE